MGQLTQRPREEQGQHKWGRHEVHSPLRPLVFGDGRKQRHREHADEWWNCSGRHDVHAFILDAAGPDANREEDRE